MSWEDLRKDGIQQYKKRNYTEAVALFTKAIEAGGQAEHSLYDARAATYEQLGDFKLGLLDAKKVIGLASEKWQGYARAARIFHRASRFDEAAKMADRAIARIPVGDTARRKEMVTLRHNALDQRRRTQDHTARLPVEILDEIFRLLVDADHTALLPLLLVCVRWRRVAEGNPYLWTVLSLHNRKPVWKLRRWAACSRNRIRDVRLAPGLGLNLEWAFGELSILDWTRVRALRIGSWDPLPFLEKIGQRQILGDLTELEILETDNTTDRGALLAETHSLRVLRLFNICITQPLLDGLWSLRNLAHLELRCNNIAAQSLANICGNNPDLQTLVVEATSRAVETLTDINVHAMHALTRLELTGAFRADLIMMRLRVPALERLSLMRGFANIDRGFMYMCNQARTSLLGHTALTHLTIHSYMVMQDSVVDLLRASPLLRGLELRGLENVANYVLEHLEVPRPGRKTRSDVVLCPQLRRVAVPNCPDVKTGPVVRMVGSRLSAAGLSHTSPPAATELIATDPKALHKDAEAKEMVERLQPLESTSDVERSANSEVAEATAIRPISELILDGCPEIEAEHLPWLKERVKRPSEAVGRDSEPAPDDSLSAKPEWRTASPPAVDSQYPTPSPGPSKLNVHLYQVNQFALVNSGGDWYKVRILEAEMSNFILDGPVKSRKRAGLSSFGKPKTFGKGWRERAREVKKARASKEASVMAERPDAAAYKVYKIHYENFNAAHDEWVPAWMLHRFVTASDEQTSAGPKALTAILKNKTILLANPPTRGSGHAPRGREARNRNKAGIVSVTAPPHDSRQGHKKPKAIPQPMKLDMPASLRKILVDDWENVQKKQLIIKMPCTPNVDEILHEFQTYLETEPLDESLCDPKVYASIITGGIKVEVYFEKAIGRNLLYPPERAQYSGWRTQFKTGQHVTPETTKDMSEAYGAMHLLRLMANFPQYMATSDLDPPSIHVISDYINEFLRWLDRNHENLFRDEYMVQAHYFRYISEYFMKPAATAA
uniref:Chromatin modification-related protein EAF3 n=1 Tax=Schizophyllum commune (strain H4-8 / FGSC 9210) TaxID=578458 RepID=D8PXC1_SCHCM